MKLLRYIILPILLYSAFAQAQSYELQKANQYFNNTYYSKAIPIYEEIIRDKKKPAILLNLADAYYFTFQVEKATQWYGFLLKNYTDKLSDQQLFQYTQSLKAKGNYTQANSIFQQYLITTEKEKEHFNAQLHYLENVKAIGKRFAIKNLPLNTKNAEFGGTFFQNKFIFSGTPKKTGLFSKMFYWNNSPYLDLYFIPKAEINTSSEVKLFSERLNTRFHEANAVFSPDGKTVYFTRNNYLNGNKERDTNHVTQLQIYKAEFIEGKWKNISSLPINNNHFSNEHPALSPDGKILYFASNRPGGYGNFDLYKVNTQTFEHPENLGEEINTPQKEQFPFVDGQGNLYFASDGHPGFGHLDIFISKTEDKNTFKKPDNIGLPVNSGYDDFAFYINSKTKEGYFSSNRPTGRGSDDIYQFQETLPLVIEDCYQLITGVVIDKTTGKPLPKSEVTLIQQTNHIDKITTGTKATFQFKVKCSESYTLSATKINYNSDSLQLLTSSTRKKKHKVRLQLLSLQEIKKQEKEEAIAKEKTFKKREEEKKKAIALKQQQKETEKKERIHAILAKEKAIVKEKDRYLIKTEPIYFDYDLWYIRKESRIVLNKVISLLKKYPEMKLEIGTHTDIRGNKKYNQNLSEKRSNSVMVYFESQGINPYRITPKGYGESNPIIYCATEESCTEEEHEINRRCEFIITSFD